LSVTSKKLIIVNNLKDLEIHQKVLIKMFSLSKKISNSRHSPFKISGTWRNGGGSAYITDCKDSENFPILSVVIGVQTSWIVHSALS
jgi:hypothetical protein